MRRFIVPAALAAAIATALVGIATAAPVAPSVVKTSTLPSIGLAELQSATLPGTVPATVPPGTPATEVDRNLDLGGVGSGLFRAPGTSANEFWTVTDRGPNGRVNPPGPPPRVRTLAAPWFDPTILHVRASGPALEILDAIPIVTDDDEDGDCDDPVTGQPNIPGYDEALYAYDGLGSPYWNPNGLDTEGIVRLPGGDFYVVDEYSPSLVHLDPAGCVLERHVPEGLPLAADYPVIDDIPGVYTKRKGNRGFEGIALSPDSRYLFLALQSPLLDPDKDTGEASRNTRILRYDLESEEFDAEYAYQFDPVNEFDPENALDAPDEMKLSGLAALSSTKLLVEERTDWVTKIYLVDLEGGTDILGFDFDGTTLEARDLDTDVDIDGLPKTLVADLDGVAGVPLKIEGIAIVDRRMIAVANDNDFNVREGGLGEAFDADGNMLLDAKPSQVLRIRLPQLLPAG